MVSIHVPAFNWFGYVPRGKIAGCYGTCMTYSSISFKNDTDSVTGKI